MDKSVKIPKIIHYVWLGCKPLDKRSLKCIESWKKYCPNFKIIRWDESNFDFSKNTFACQAYKKRKYAFASDFIRLSVLYKYGGIYLDTDMELLKPINSFMFDDGFVGFESDKIISCGIIGCKKGNIHIKRILDYYSNIDFVLSNDELNLNPITHCFTTYFFKIGTKINGKTQTTKKFKIYSKDYFYPIGYFNGKFFTNNTVSIHHWNSSWKDHDFSLKMLIKKTIKLPIKILIKLVRFSEKKYKNKKTQKQLNSLYMKYREFIDNKDFENKTSNRCFIIGNGPSSKFFNFNKIKNDDVITVNQISKNPRFPFIKPRFHFTIDGNFYDDLNLAATRNNFANIYKKVGENNNGVIYFFPVESRNTRLIKELEKKYKIRYFNPCPLIDFNESYKIDSFSNVPIYRTVVLTAIHFAIYCGYKEIYLIGCEETNIMTLLETKLNKLKQLHYGYLVDEKEIKRTYDYFNETNLSDKLSEFAILFKQFEILKDICDKKGIKLYNLTKESLIDSIPYFDIYKK